MVILIPWRAVEAIYLSDIINAVVIQIHYAFFRRLFLCSTIALFYWQRQSGLFLLLFNMSTKKNSAALVVFEQ